MRNFIRSSLGLTMLVALVLSLVVPAVQGSPSATMRFMEHLHGSAAATEGGEAKLYGESQLAS